jgi:hypothetical protein
MTRYDESGEKKSRGEREKREEGREKSGAVLSYPLFIYVFAAFEPVYSCTCVTHFTTHVPPRTVPGIRHVHYSSMSPSRAFTVGL